MATFNNPEFGRGLSAIAQAIAGDPYTEARTEAAIAQANRNTAAANIDIQSAELRDAIQANMGNLAVSNDPVAQAILSVLAPGAALGQTYTGQSLNDTISAALGVPGTSVSLPDQAQFQVAAGTQAFTNTISGAREDFANQQAKSRISAGPGYAAVAENRRQFDAELVGVVDPETGRAVMVPRSQASGRIPVIPKADAQGGIVSAVAPDIVAGNPISSYAAAVADAVAGGDRREPRNYITPDQVRGTTLDGITDATTGNPLPQGTQTFTGAVQSDSADPFFTTATQTGLEGDVLAAGDFNNVVDSYTANLTENPTSVGVVGRIRKLAQDIGGQSQLVQEAFGGDIGQKYAEAASALGAAGIQFDPSIDEIQQAATILAYQAAAAVARQEGRGLSDQDFKTFRKVVGDPNALLATPQSLLARANQLKQIVNARTSSRDRALSTGTIQIPQRAGTGTTAPTRLRYNPDTGQIE